MIIDDNVINSGSLKLPDKFNGKLTVNVSNTNGLKLPKEFEGYLKLKGFVISNNLVLPEKFKGFLHLNEIISAEGIQFPNYFEGFCCMNLVKDPKSIKLPFPETLAIQKNYSNLKLMLNGLESIKGLTLPYIAALHINGVISLEDVKFYCRSLRAEKVIEVNNIKFMEEMIYLELPKLTTARDLTLPKKVLGRLDLGTVALEEIILPEDFECEEIIYDGCYHTLEEFRDKIQKANRFVKKLNN